MYKKMQKGFTIVEILIAVLIISLIMAMALPNFLKGRTDARKKACIANLWQLNEAIKQWVLENDINTGASIEGNESEIYSYLRFGEPTCPSDGTYTYGVVGTEPQVTCSKGDSLGHVLE